MISSVEQLTAGR